MWASRFTDTTIGAYNAMFIVVATVPEGAPAQRTCLAADANGASSALVMFDGTFDEARALYENRARLFLVRLLDSTQVAIDVGRERMGTDKRPGTIDMAGELTGTGVTVNALHPASYMNTTRVRQAGVTPWSSVETGADAILNLATSPALEGRSGLYFDGQKESRADAQAYDAKARQQLRALSLDLVGQASAKSKEQHS